MIETVSKIRMCDKSRDDDNELLTKGINAERNDFDQCILLRQNSNSLDNKVESK
ncbi:hypothetical protein RIR_e33504_A0A2I1FAY1_9GLOM [Rhizophagus irregularis DAOM 181602=DAOM 197198]|nr:hypothetical protein RIR_e33504_A0A2I1FAY1_9GLOM [Rhizophagus irregularis DAOM 181602=DAOM 197198]